METWFEIGLAITLTFLALTCCAANVLGLPGNWVAACVAGLSYWLRPENLATHVGLEFLIGIVVAAGIGELVEFAASALGVSSKGGSRRGTLLAMVGSIVGAIAGLFFGLGVPIIGQLIASLMLGAAGAFGGAILGERWAGKDWDSSLQIGSAAFWGRLLGTFAKVVCGTVVCGLFIVAVWF
ncbi:MAG: DUF456 family protein [Pirellulaceae bacterium]